ncbi:hypothetical protein PQE34_003524 [Klebsiella aerogenes]|nr:hypothetical protein [Klebsiella aerogenes]
MRLLIFALSLLSAQCVFAASGCDLNTIVKKAWPDGVPQGKSIIIRGKSDSYSPQSAICRVWPAHPELTLAAIPLMSHEQTDYEHTGDLELLILNSATLEVKQRLRLVGRMNDDSISIDNIALDTARWKITPTQTAFGLRITQRNPSRVAPFREEVLWLYSYDNNQIHKVLNGLVVNRTHGEWDGMCAGEFDHIERTLVMVPSSGNGGYANIRVSEKNVHTTRTISEENDCEDMEKIGKETWLLHFDGKHYPIPKKLAPLLD